MHRKKSAGARRALAFVFFSLLLANHEVTAQTNNSTNSDNDATWFCNSSIASANASGLFTFAVDYPLGNGTSSGPTINVPDPSWALTVDVRNSSTHSSIWYDTAGQNYSDDLSINYDACAYIITGGLPINTLELGQDDPGDCSSMFSDACRSAILDRAAASAHNWVSYASPPPYSNLSAGVLPSICSYIFGDLGDDDATNFVYPQACAQEFGYTHAINEPLSTLSLTLTGYNSSALDRSSCTRSSGNKTLHNIETIVKDGSTATYDNITRSIYPALSVYFPVANINRHSYYSGANSSLRCLRVQDYGTDSRVSPALPAGQPYRYSHGLSKGAIAGIVVGVVVGVAIVAGLLTWICLRRRKQAKSTAEASESRENGVREVKDPEMDGIEISELPPTDRKPEIQGSSILELSGHQRPAELGDHSKPAELSAVSA